jgi:hypothetical protein
MYSDQLPVETQRRLPHARPAVRFVHPFSSSENLHASDTPELNQAVVNYARSQYGARVGTGLCYDLAAAAIQAAGAKLFPPKGLPNGKSDPNENYVWGTNVGTFTPGAVDGVSTLIPGDILQFRSAHFSYEYNGIKYTADYEQHSAIVNAVNGTRVEILEQHTTNKKHGPVRSFVTKRVLDFSGLLRGTVWAYRPEPASP